MATTMFRATQAMRMQPTRMMFMQPTRMLGLRQTAVMRSPVPKDSHQAHTISQRIRQLKKIPAELIPLGIVLLIAVGAAAFSLVRKLMVDKTLRLKRQAGRE
ncbi:hypothetical protein BDV96DRAFT_599180 [Lophiotrema nucula]|uniref:NADH-ubiquinone reductase complex 1 MLRQ subunit-domain-containing protein n=1 Tax=Lophiotrema nucula TaxID=690887 RepID=A0A6A5Z8H3_9PLEO|nr:hypothetical protein BDV96DRAFT_599180 [Lophiotrema nucula]